MSKFDKDIPIPPRTGGKKSMFEGMEVGDSLSSPRWRSSPAAQQAFAHYVKNHRLAWRATARKMPDGSIRLWRIE